MYNIIWMIKDGQELSYLYFKDKAISTVFYDNNLKKLIINFGDSQGNRICSSIQKLSNDEIKKNAILLPNMLYLFQQMLSLFQQTDNKNNSIGEQISYGNNQKDVKKR